MNIAQLTALAQVMMKSPGVQKIWVDPEFMALVEKHCGDEPEVMELFRKWKGS